MRALTILIVLALSLTALPFAASALPLVGDDDAGSGRDAPDEPVDGVRIAPFTIHEGALTGVPRVGGDLADYYAFHADAGDRVSGIVLSGFGCAGLLAPDGTQVANTCYVGGLPIDSLSAVAEQSGTWFLSYASAYPHPYRFSVGVGEFAPKPLHRLGDAGYEEDAPDSRAGALSVEPGRAYDAWHNHLSDDAHDWFAFDVGAGESVSARAEGAATYACLELVDASGAVVARDCGENARVLEASATAESAGTWFLHHSALQWGGVDVPYAFGVGIDAPAPAASRTVG